MKDKKKKEDNEKKKENNEKEKENNEKKKDMDKKKEKDIRAGDIYIPQESNHNS